jgi:uncharacterized membrane protein YkoI
MNTLCLRRLSRIVPLALLAALSLPVLAGPDRWVRALPEPAGYAPMHVAQRRVSLEQAIAIAQRQTGGRVLDAKEQGSQYRIKLLTRRGEVIVVYVDAETGAVR